MKEKKLVVFDMDGTLNRIELFIIPPYKEVLRRFSRRSTAYLLFFVSYSLDSRTAHQHTPDTGNIQAGSGLDSRMAAEAAAYRR